MAHSVQAGSLVGQRLGKYELLALLAIGGTAEIYLARIGGEAGFEKYVVVKSLLDNGLSIQRVRRAWDYLRRTGDMDEQLSNIRLVTDGQSVFAIAHDDTELLDALRQGQLAFFVRIDEIAQDVEDDVTKFELDRESFRTLLATVEDDVKLEAGEAAG